VSAGETVVPASQLDAAMKEIRALQTAAAGQEDSGGGIPEGSSRVRSLKKHVEHAPNYQE